ncbi:restriction endonuclease subunit S [Agarivorans aestuarii]|uniref:restriction endonuclease subunit S n=1 Tax=Agarivorans aestuarii TaxID=1563703 RepID=UPI001C7E8D94|nr:restriction endonuclease subunit S [Agarivorans aestuarii]
MGKYQAYPDYKDACIDWLGAIPEHWMTSKLRYTFSFGKGLTITKENLKDTGVPCVSYGEVHSKYGFEVDPLRHPLKCVDEEYIQSSPYALLKNGDIVFADTSEDIDGSGNFTQLVSDELVFAGYHTIIARPFDRECCRFYAYLLDSKELRTQIRHAVKGVKVFSITQAILRGVNIWLPPLEERAKIASFLDHETAKIDTLIDKQQQLIELLKEKRQAVISHAVTKGLNPDAPMKDSGVEWLGEVPEHWGVSSLGYYALLNTGATPDRANSSYWLGDIPWIKTGEVKYETIYSTEETISSLAVKQTSVQLSPPGTLLMAMYGQGVTRGRVALLGVSATYNQACAAITTNNFLWNEYLRAFFIAGYHAIRDGGNETSQMNLNADIVRKFKVTIPPKGEQESIVHYLNNELPKLDVLLKKADSAIALMQERRSALISAAVTGKIDVRNWQVPVNQETQQQEAG